MFDYSKISDVELAEAAIFSLAYNNPPAWPVISRQLQPKHFARKGADKIFSLFEKKYQDGLFDSAQMENELITLAANCCEPGNPVGGFVADIFSGPVTLNPQFFIDKLTSEYFERSKKQIDKKVALAASRNEDFEPYLKERDNLLRETSDSELLDKEQMVEEFMSGIYEVGKIKMLETGFASLDAFLGGWRSQALYILAGRPGHGKTSFALNTFLAAIKRGFSPIFISTEMSNVELVNRMVSIISGVPGYIIDKGLSALSDLDNEKVSEALKKLRSLPGDPVLVSRSFSLSELQSLCKKARFQRGKVEMIIIDYLTRLKVDTRGQNREREVAQLVSGCKDLAIDYKCPVILLAQPSRDIERRENKRPMNADLRDSGQIEQDADAIVWTVRDNVFDVNAADYSASVYVTKNRHGPTGDFSLRYIAPCFRFLET